MDMTCLFRVGVIFLLSGGLVACGGSSKKAPPPATACLADPIVLEGGGSSATPPVCMKSCMADEECTVVNTSCPGCCEFVPLSKSYEAHYEKKKGEECRKYSGLVCGCGENTPRARCIQNVCTLD